MKNKNAAKKIETGSVLFYALTQLLLLVMILITAFVLYEYQDGMRQAKYDEEFSQKEEIKFKGQANKNDTFNVLLVMDESVTKERGKANRISLLQYNRHTKTPKIVTFFKETQVKLVDDTSSLANIYQKEGVESVRQSLVDTFNVNAEYYIVLTPYTFTKLVNQVLPKTFEFNGKHSWDAETLYKKITDPTLSESQQLTLEKELSNRFMHQVFAPTNITKLPGFVGSAFGYLQTNITLAMATSHVKDFVLGEEKALEQAIIPLEYQNNQEKVPQIISDFDRDENTKEILRILE